MEVWKDIAGYEGLYQVSNLGRVKSLGRDVKNHSGQWYFKPEQIKQPSVRKSNGKPGYLAVMLYKDNRAKNCYVHRLVAEAFIPNPNNKKTVNHKSGDKYDNRTENLEWATYRENNAHAFNTGLNDSTHRRNRKDNIAILQYDSDMNLIGMYPSMREAERQTGIDCAAISLGVKKGWKYGGFVWKKEQ